MYKFLKKRLKNEKGAIDKILVTLLLVVIGVAGIIGLSVWEEEQKHAILDASENSIATVTNGG